ncbi:MAG TPA: GGDEF domain-containing protein [Methylibium sp.]|nr:GGDEF domain-containing protein [Methylibium sp.]
MLRLVVARMGQHDAAFNPVTFAVWYEHVAGMNPALSAALDALLENKARLGDEAVCELYLSHVAPPDTAITERIGSDFQRVMDSLVEASSRTGRTAQDYGERLNGLERALGGDGPAAALGHSLDLTLQGTREMQRSVHALRETVTSSEREIKQLRSELDRTRAVMVTDPLTGVLNRRGFDELLQRILSTPPSSGKVHCLVLLDIDHFKRINDAHGHLTGDEVLKALGAILQRVAGDSGMHCARYGGEEFAVLLPETTMADTLSAAGSICALVRAMKVRNRGTGQVVATATVSAGIAAWQPGEDGLRLVAAADKALYRSKDMGRDRISVA